MKNQITMGRSVKVFAVSFLFALGLMSGPVFAQQAGLSQSENADEMVMQDVPSNLQDIAGVKAGMTMTQLVDLATEMTVDKRLVEASKVLVYVVRRDQDNVRAFNQLARVYKRLAEDAREEGGSSAQQRAERYDRWAVGAYLEAAETAYEDEDYTTAEELYNKVFMMDPSNAECKLGLARVFSETGRKVQAQQHYKDYIKSPAGRTNADAYLELAKVYGELKSPFQRLSTLIEARELDPENVEVLKELARAFFDRQQIGQATSIAQEAVDKDPQNTESRFTLATILMARDEFDKAEEQITRAIELAREQLQRNPDDQELLSKLSKYYTKYGTLLRQRLNQDDKNLDARIRLAEIIRERATVDRLLIDLNALSVLQEAGPEAEENIRYLELLARLQHLTKKKEEASTTCRQLLEKDPDNTVAQRILESIQGKSNAQAAVGGSIDSVTSK
jgi:tetratricopeptide (TPR) repeat protein